MPVKTSGRFGGRALRIAGAVMLTLVGVSVAAPAEAREGHGPLMYKDCGSKVVSVRWVIADDWVKVGWGATPTGAMTGSEVGGRGGWEKLTPPGWSTNAGLHQMYFMWWASPGTVKTFYVSCVNQF